MSCTEVAIIRVCPFVQGCAVATQRARRGVRPELAVLGAVLVATVGTTWWATSRYGIGMTSDSVGYRGSALSLAEGLGYSQDGTASTIFPPGYSFVLSLFERLGVDTVDGARIVAVVAFAVTTALGFVLLRRHVRSPAVLMAGTVVIGCSAVLLSIFERSVSEHLFIVVVLLLLLVAEELLDRPEHLWLLIAACALVGAAFYLRYAGLVLVPFTAFVVLVASRSAGRLRAVARAGVVVALSLSTPVLWMLRNLDAGSDAMGTRRDASASLLTNIERTTLTLGGWVSFQGPTPLRVAALAALAGGAMLLVVLARPTVARVVEHGREVWPLLLFVVGYVAYLVLTATIVAFAPISTRYLIPVFVPLVVLAAWAFDRAQPRLRGPLRVAVTTGALVWIVANAAWFGARALESRQHGAGGYATQAWRESALIDEVAQWPATDPIVTNDVPAVELFTGRRLPESVPRTFLGSNEASGSLPAFVERVRCEGHVALAWFTRSGTRQRLYSPRELARHLRVTPLVEVADGVIFDLTPLEAASQSGCPPA